MNVLGYLSFHFELGWIFDMLGVTGKQIKALYFIKMILSILIICFVSTEL